MIVILAIIMIVYIASTLALHIITYQGLERQRRRVDRLTDTCRERDRSLTDRVKRLENWRRGIVLAAEARHERREQP